jgi:hypothetical protein
VIAGFSSLGFVIPLRNTIFTVEGIMVGIELRNGYRATDLWRLARKVRDAKQARRLMALAGVVGGLGRTNAATIGLMDCQTLRGWGNGCPELCLGDRIQHGTVVA